MTYPFCGLGNPGDKYDGTRHNIGRDVLIATAKKFGLPSFKRNTKWNALISEGKIGKTKVILILPETFVNKSGHALRPAMRYFKVKPRDFVLVHDDVDILLGRTKLSFGRNSGGHKGVESVMRALKTKDFWRMRVGIQKKRRVPGEDLVLQKFRGDEEAIAKKMIKKSVDAIEAITAEGPEKAMNNYNK